MPLLSERGHESRWTGLLLGATAAVEGSQEERGHHYKTQPLGSEWRESVKGQGPTQWGKVDDGVQVQVRNSSAEQRKWSGAQM